MNIVEQKETMVTTVPVYLNAPVKDDALVSWLLCHGYGQRADRLIRKWNDFDTSVHRVVSAEAPHRFYWQGQRDMPVATWMTSRLRLDDIQNNNDHFDSLYDKYIAKSPTKVLLGFSQGGTTLWRWIHDRRPDFDLFINYAGWMPEDIDLMDLQKYLGSRKLVFCYGDRDQYLQSDRVEAFQQVLSRSGLNVDIVQFAGEHRVYRKVLADLVEKYVT